MNDPQANPPKRSPSGATIAKIAVVVAVLVALVAVAIWTLSTFKLYRVPQKGMYPGIAAGDMVVGRKRAYGSPADVKRGDIVVFNSEKDGKTYDFIWRVIGLPGEEIAIVDDVVVIDGERFKRVRLRSENARAIYSEQRGDQSWEIALPEPATDPAKSNMRLRKLGEGEFFLLGDNRYEAYDSRETGPVPFARIVARVVYP